MIKIPALNLSFFILAGTLTFPIDAAQSGYHPYSEWSTSMLGMGGARRTFADDASAVITNPAGLAFNKNQVAIEVSGGWFDRFDANQLMASIIDGQTGPVIGGFQFSRYSGENFEKYGYSLAAGYPYQNFFFGATTRLLDFNGIRGTDKVWVNNVGFIGSLSETIFFSVSMENLGLSDAATYAPMTLAFGAGALIGTMRAVVETTRPLESPPGGKEDFNLSFGGEMSLRNYGIIRGGYYWDRIDDGSFWSIGGGVVAEKSTIAMAYIREVDRSKSGFNFMLRIAF